MPEDNKKTPHSKIVQTYAEDAVKVIEGDRQGLIKKIIHSEEENEKIKRSLSPESKKNKLFVLLGSILLLLASGTFTFFIVRGSTPPVAVEQEFVPLIFTDKNAIIEVGGLKKEAIEAKVIAEISTADLAKGETEGIYFSLNKKPVGLREFALLLGSSFAPGNNPFIDDNFLLGAVSGETRDFFILLKMRSLGDIFSAMQGWETKMFLDLHGFFGLDIGPANQYFLTKSFEDGIVGNKNARILYNAEGKIVMMYVFADENSVVITDTNEAAGEIMLRLAASRVKQ